MEGVPSNPPPGRVWRWKGFGPGFGLWGEGFGLCALRGFDFGLARAWLGTRGCCWLPDWVWKVPRVFDVQLLRQGCNPLSFQRPPKTNPAAHQSVVVSSRRVSKGLRTSLWEGGAGGCARRARPLGVWRERKQPSARRPRSTRHRQCNSRAAPFGKRAAVGAKERKRRGCGRPPPGGARGRTPDRKRGGGRPSLSPPSTPSPRAPPRCVSPICPPRPARAPRRALWGRWDG